MANNALPTFTIISSIGVPVETRTLLYFPGIEPTTTETGGLLSPTASGLDVSSTTSASIPTSSSVGSSSTSSSTSTTSSPPVGAVPNPSVTPAAPNPVSPTSDIPTTVLSSPSSISPSGSPSTSSRTSTSNHPTKSATSGAPVPSHRLANGTVAGIVIGVALGLALITFLTTFLVIRRRRGSRGKRNSQISELDGLPSGKQNGQISELDGRPSGKRNRQIIELDGRPSGSARHQTLSSGPKQPLLTQTFNSSNSFDDFLPQSADDKTVQNEVKTVLDQIELHVENFYQNTQASGSRLADAELAMFDSPYLPSSLASLLPQTNNSMPIIKHALAHFITACITTPSDTDWSLLPKDFVLLPNAIRAGGSNTSTKQGFTQSMSRWRALTAYLRPNALEDTAYIAQRDRQISIIVQNFSIAFAPWQNPRYRDEERVHSLVAILKDAADKGIWLFSQPSEFQFQWQKLSPSRIAVAPALVKVTDERGQVLGKPQVMIDMTAKKL